MTFLKNKKWGGPPRPKQPLAPFWRMRVDPEFREIIDGLAPRGEQTDLVRRLILAEHQRRYGARATAALLSD